jgi:hypothetical protein
VFVAAADLRPADRVQLPPCELDLGRSRAFGRRNFRSQKGDCTIWLQGSLGSEYIQTHSRPDVLAHECAH